MADHNSPQNGPYQPDSQYQQESQPAQQNSAPNRKPLIIAAIAAVVAIPVLGGVAWFATSESRDLSKAAEGVQETTEILDRTDDIVELNAQICAEYRASDEEIATLADIAGPDEFTESSSENPFGEIDKDNLRFISDQRDEVRYQHGDESFRFRHEDDRWLLCDSGVNMKEIAASMRELEDLFAPFVDSPLPPEQDPALAEFDEEAHDAELNAILEQLENELSDLPDTEAVPEGQ